MIVLKVAGSGVLLAVFFHLLTHCATTKCNIYFIQGLAGLTILGTVLATLISLWFL